MNFEQNRAARFAVVDNRTTFSGPLAVGDRDASTPQSYTCAANAAWVTLTNVGDEDIAWSTGAEAISALDEGEPLAAGASKDIPVAPGTVLRFSTTTLAATGSVSITEVLTP